MWKKIILVIILVALIFVVLFFAKGIKQTEAPVIPLEQEQQLVKTLNVKHQYKDGIHTFVGDLDLPNPCYTYNAVIEDTSDLSQKNLKIILNKKEEQNSSCIQVITKANYNVSYKGAKDLIFRGFVNDEEYKLNIFEIPEDVDINVFEIFMKG